MANYDDHLFAFKTTEAKRSEELDGPAVSALQRAIAKLRNGQSLDG
jgi:hypothetical protein